jgi:hypothetical protein
MPQSLFPMADGRMSNLRLAEFSISHRLLTRLVRWRLWPNLTDCLGYGIGHVQI